MIRALALVLLFAARPAWAQTLQLPPKNAPPAVEINPSNRPPAAAPPSAVQQVVPLASPSLLGHSAPAKSPPVVQPPANGHAQKAPPPKQAKAAEAKPGPKSARPLPPPPAMPPEAAAKPESVPTAANQKPAGPSVGSVTHLPLPRFAALRSDEVNLRSGPGFRYPIEWVYRRRDLPVEILREYDEWRLIADQDGVRGWIHVATLTGRRSFVVKGHEEVMRRDPAETAAAVAILKPGVIGRIRTCKAGGTWCQVQVRDYRGWVKRTAIWGVSPGEVID
jgi:SH3-like domain-containing protein